MYIFTQPTDCDRFICKYNRLFEQWASPNIKLHPQTPRYMFWERDEFMTIPLNKERLPRNAVVIGTDTICAGAVIYGYKCISLPHSDSIVDVDMQVDSDDPLREVKDFQKIYWWWRISYEALKLYGRNKVLMVRYFEKPANKLREDGFKVVIVPGFVENNINVAPSDQPKYDVVVNVCYWKTWAKPLDILLSHLKDLKVAVHDYSNMKSLEAVARKHGVDYYGKLSLEEYYKLYANTKVAYIYTRCEAFGYRFYEIGQITLVASNIRHYDDIFIKVKVQELKDFVRGVDIKMVKEFREKILERVKTLTVENTAKAISNIFVQEGKKMVWW